MEIYAQNPGSKGMLNMVYVAKKFFFFIIIIVIHQHENPIHCTRNLIITLVVSVLMTH